MRDATLLFLTKRQGDRVDQICLAMKKRGFGAGKWNGVGGKPEPEDLSIEATARREAFEEIGVQPQEIEKVGEMQFEFPHNPDWNMRVHVYFCEEWTGEPAESEEMKPEWYKIEDIPHNQMWADDWYWLPKALRGEYIEATFKYKDDENIEEYVIKGKVTE